MHYKAPDNSVHYLDDDSLKHLLPSGSVQITDAEAEAIRASNLPKPCLKAEAKAYLASTDWLVVRFAETGAVIPSDVTAKRAECRSILSKVYA